jgi:hypothetical protein
MRQLPEDLIEDVHIVHFAVSNADKRGDTAAQVQQRVHLHRGFVLAKLCPGQQGEAQVDRGRVECVKRVIQVQPDRISRIQRPGDTDQIWAKSGEDMPVMSLISIGQSRAWNSASETHVIEFAAQGSEARLNVSEALAVSELSESHCQVLIPARETPVVTVAGIAGNTLLEFVMRNVGDQLREYGPASIHPPLFRRGRLRSFWPIRPVSVQIVFQPNAVYLIER